FKRRNNPKQIMKLLLTSSGISNTSIHNALVELLGKPVTESSALFIPTAIYPYPGGGNMAWRALSGKSPSPLSQLGWKCMGVLELSVLPSIDKKAWVQAVEETDALLFWGGNPVFLSYWMRQSGLTDLLPSLQRALYVGVSAGSRAASRIFAECFTNPHSSNNSGNTLTSEEITYDTPGGEAPATFVTANGAGLVDFAIIPHLDNTNHLDASMANAEKWAARLPVPVYAIDDQSAIKVTGGNVEVVSEGNWKLFTPK